MSVYTELSSDDMNHILAAYALGACKGFEGIAAGIENSNFFVETDSGRYVLTVFERMDAGELPYFMYLMHHLAAGGVPCPDVILQRDGSSLFEIAGKRGCIVSCLPGRTLDVLNAAQLRSSGSTLAGLHVAGASFKQKRENPTGFTWLQHTVDVVQEKTREQYGNDTADLLLYELQFQQTQAWEHLPRGVIHGDLFVDNILFQGDTVSGVIDFYYAHDAPYALDLSIALNAQAILLRDDDQERMQVFLEGYEQVRRLEDTEQDALPGLLRLAALRFWVSRLYDALFPRGGAMTQTKDPGEYRKKLLIHLSKSGDG